MVRTKADAARKAGAKAPRKEATLRGQSSSSGVKSSANKGSKGSRNTYCKRPTPDWQIPIKKFLIKQDDTKEALDSPEEEVMNVSDNLDEAGPSTETVDSEEESICSDKDQPGTSNKDVDANEEVHCSDE